MTGGAAPADGGGAEVAGDGSGAEELNLLRRTVREAFDDLSPPAEVRRQLETAEGWDRTIWRRLCGELGLPGLAVPEAYGGGGFSYVELGIVFEEAGRSLLCAPLLATSALAAPLLMALGDEPARRRLLPALCEGSLVATVVTADEAGRSLPGGRAGPGGIRADPRPGGEWSLHGVGGFVVDGATADVVLVPARAGDDIAVFEVAAGADGLAVEPLVTLDPTRRQAKLRFDGATATRLGTGDASAALTRALDVARALLASEQAGGAGHCLDMTVAYAKSRVQFGRPIGSFQAIKQKAADLLIQVESARSAAGAAAQAATGDAPELPEPAVVSAVAKAYCSEAYVAVAAETIQLHGGIGFTWEHDAHLYFKRAWTSAELLGGPVEHLEDLARRLETR